MGADTDLRQHKHTVTVDIDAGVRGGDTFEQAEQQGCTGDVQGLPVTEDHNRQGQEAEACHLAGGGTVGGGKGVHKAAHTGQGTGDGGTGIAHLVHIDAQRVGSLGIFTAGAQPQTKAGLVEQNGQDDKQDDADISGQIGLINEGGAEEAHLLAASVSKEALFDHEVAGRVALRHLQGVLVGHDADEEEHQGGSQQVQSGTADGLVCLQIHRCEGEQQGENGAQHRGNYHSQDHKALEGYPVTGSP